jgi:putative addiction module killer protein
MELIPREVRLYLTKNGRAPYQEWWDDLKNVEVKAVIIQRVNRLKWGHFGDCRAVHSGVFEMRIHLGAGYRVYFAQEKQRIILLLCGGDKSSQSKDIQKAQAYWKDFKEQYHG